MCVPHAPQNERANASVQLYFVGSAAVNLSSEAGTGAHGAQYAPRVRRQSLQWQ